MAEKTLLDLYHRVNDRSSPRFVYHLGGDSGFFSEYNNMILAILYCLDKKIRFSIYSKDANFKYKEGWNDYFSPFVRREVISCMLILTGVRTIALKTPC